MKTINIVKLQCLRPGVITLYYSREKISNFYQGTNISYYKSNMTYTYDYYRQAPTNIYFQVFTITCWSEVDLRRIKGDIIKNSFYKKVYYPYPSVYYNVYVFCTQCLMLSTVNVGENNKTLEKENEDILAKSGEITYISLGYDKSSIKIEVLPRNIDATTKVLMEETFTAIDAREFELPAGEYTIRITAKKGATGSMDIKAK